VACCQAHRSSIEQPLITRLVLLQGPALTPGAMSAVALVANKYVVD
jgi:hypothetical protein